METLVSLKNTYADFKKAYDIDLANAKGELRKGLKYGEFYDLPMERNTILYYIGNDEKQFKNVTKLLEWHITKQEYNFKIVVGKNIDKDRLPEQVKENVMGEASEKAIRSFVSAEYIIANGMLPRYFVRKQFQKVIQVFDNVDKTLNKEQISQDRISWMLNSTMIFVNECDKKTFLKDYHIPQEYAKSVFEIDHEPRWEEKVIAKIHDTDILKEQSDKKHILLVASAWNLGGHEETYIKLFANNINYDKYDLTLLMKRPDNGNSEEVLQNINENMRIIYRRGTFPCNKEEYTKTQYLLKNFDSLKDIEKAYELLDRKIIQRECRRMLGDMEFLEVVFIGKHSAVWSVIAENVKAVHHVRLINHDLQQELLGYTTEAKQLGFYNKIHLYEHMFDKIVFTNVQYLKSTVEQNYFLNPKVTVFEFPNKISDDIKADKLQYVEYEGKHYFIGQEYEYLHGGKRITLFPVPSSEDKAYIANSDMCDKDTLVKMFTEIYKQDPHSLFVVYGKDAEDVRQSGRQMGLDGRIETIERKTLETISAPGQYLNSFEACLITEDDQEYCPITAYMELIGKKILIYQNDTLMEYQRSKFKDLNTYNTYVQQLWDQFFDGKLE